MIDHEEDIEDANLAWMYFAIYTCGIIPMIAGLGNYLQWIVHHRWVTKGGKVTDVLTKSVPRELQRDDFVTAQEAGRYVAMA